MKKVVTALALMFGVSLFAHADVTPTTPDTMNQPAQPQTGDQSGSKQDNSQPNDATTQQGTNPNDGTITPNGDGTGNTESTGSSGSTDTSGDGSSSTTTAP